MKRKKNEDVEVARLAKIGISLIGLGVLLIIFLFTAVIGPSVGTAIAQTFTAPKTIYVNSMPEMIDSTVAHVVSKIKNDDGKTETVEIVVIAHVHHGGAYDSHPIRTVDLKLPLNTTNAQIKAAFLNSMKNPDPTPTPDTL